MSAKNKGAKGAKTKQREEKAKPAVTKLIPELAAMKFPAKMVGKLEALAEADQDTVLNYVNSGMKISDAYQRTIARKPEQAQLRVHLPRLLKARARRRIVRAKQQRRPHRKRRLAPKRHQRPRRRKPPTQGPNQRPRNGAGRRRPRRRRAPRS
jgi:hypothetical protein